MLLLNCSETLTSMILLLAGSAETGKQQKSWGYLDGLCHNNWFTWHNYGVSLEEELSFFEIRSFIVLVSFPIVPTMQFNSRNDDEKQNRLI